MSSCLGICAKNNIIQYAKVSKERDSLKVDVFGVKFYEELEVVLEEILEETQSYNIPICMNLTGEIYNYFSVFSMLKKKDIAAVLNSEFEMLCEDRKINFNTLDSRYLLSQDQMNKEKSNAIYISVEKADITSKMQKLQKYKVSNLAPLPIAVANLIKNEPENIAIVNIEDNTTITTISNGEIVGVDILEAGMKEILEKINEKENDIRKAYEICKNTTIYTMEVSDNQLVENAYLADIMPELYKIVTMIKDKFDNQFLNVQKLYITGAAAVINNIELYFQEYLTRFKCEVLAPYFIDKKSRKINVKDYIEVNSAIGIAIQGLGEGFDDVNFKNNYLRGTLNPKTVQLKMNSDVKLPSLDKFLDKFKNINFNKEIKITNQSFKEPFDGTEKNLVRIAVAIIIFMIMFVVTSTNLVNATNKKNAEVEAVIVDTQIQISKVEAELTKVKTKKEEYAAKITKLENISNQIIQEYKNRRAIPNLLSEIMSVIPKNVKITSIENTAENKITINAESKRLEDLGFFKAKLKTDGILLNVTSTTGVKQEEVVKITIEGNLP